MSDEQQPGGPEFINPVERQHIHQNLVSRGLAVPIWHINYDGTRHFIDKQPGDNFFTTRSTINKHRTLLGICMPLGNEQYLVMQTTGADEIVIKLETDDEDLINRLDIDNTEGIVAHVRKSRMYDYLRGSSKPMVIDQNHASESNDFTQYYRQAIKYATETRQERNRRSTQNAAKGQRLLSDFLRSLDDQAPLPDSQY